MDPVVGKGFLKLVDFQNLLIRNPWLRDIELSNYGEIFLNPELLEIIKHAYQRQVAVRANNGVNFNNVREDVLDGLVRYRFRSMRCSIDGASNETYSVYRVRGNYEAVIANIKKLNHLKQKYRSEYPQLTWQFVVFGHNEHEIPVAKELARDLNMKFHLKLTWDSNFSPVGDKEFLKEEAGAASREEYKQHHGVDYMQAICHDLWDGPQINWDGKVLGCCHNFWGDFGGNALEDGLLNSINNKKIRYARGMLIGRKVARPGIPCTTCNIYLGMKTDGNWLKRSFDSRHPLAYRALRFIHHSSGLYHLRQQLKARRCLRQKQSSSISVESIRGE